MEYGEILANFRKSSGKSQKEFAELLDLPQTTWAGYELGKTEPKLSTLLLLAKKGFFIPELTTESSKEFLDDKNFQTASLQQDVKKDGFIIPVLDQSLSAGKGQLLPDDDVPIGYIAVPKELKRYGNKLAAIYVNGDSMEPTLQRGDLVVCDSCGWDGDGIYALRVDGCGYVKRLARKPGKLVVISDNPKYETWEEPTESEAVSIIGRVHYTLKHVD